MIKRLSLVAASVAFMATRKDPDNMEENEPYTLPEGIPNRLCIEGNSRFHSAATPYIGVRIDGEESKDVVEYCVSGRWVRLGKRATPGGPILRKPFSVHELQTEMLHDVTVEPYWRSQPSRQVRRALARGQ